MTVLDAVIQSLSRADEYNRDDQVAPAVILWPDKERQWEPVLRDRLGPRAQRKPGLPVRGRKTTKASPRGVLRASVSPRLGKIRD